MNKLAIFNENIDYVQDAEVIYDAYYANRPLDHKKATDEEITARKEFVTNWRNWFKKSVIEKSKMNKQTIQRFLLEAYRDSNTELAVLDHETNKRTGNIDMDLEDLLSF